MQIGLWDSGVVKKASYLFGGKSCEFACFFKNSTDFPASADIVKQSLKVACQ